MSTTTGTLLSELVKTRSPRVEKLRDKCVEAVPQICTERARLITEAYRLHSSQPIMMKRAKSLDHILNHMSIYIQEGELLVGNHSSLLRAAPVFPEYDVEFLEKEIDSFPTRPGDPFRITDEAKKELLKICAAWKGNTVRERVLAMLPEVTRKAGEDGVGAYDSEWTLYCGDGHIAPDYPRALREGIKGILAAISAKIESLDLGEPQSLSQLEFLNAASTASHAVVAFAKRYSSLARETAERASDPVQKRELREIARICEKVPENPATSFREALQSLWFVHLIVQIETNGHSVSLGRIDQYLSPFYVADLEKGAITPEAALELLQCFWIKMSELTKLRPTSDANLFPGYPMFQNATIGGQTPEGADAVNDLTYLCLSAQATVRLVQPNLTARIHRRSGRPYLHACANVIKMGMGFPSLFNDELIIFSLVNRGVKVEDAYNYCLVGCVEPSVQGKWGGRYGAGLTNLSKILEVTVHGGRDPRTGLALCPEEHDLSSFESFEPLMEAYSRQIQFYVRQQCIRDNIQDIAWAEMAPTPFLDTLVQDCIARGKSQKQGGALYDYTGGETGNIANVANSLAAIKKLVFEEKLFSGRELLKAIDSDFAGASGEKIRQLVINHAPKFGNDEDYVDTLAKRAFRIFLEEPEKYKNTRFGTGPIGGRFHPSTASISANVPFGLRTGATPDGRKAWQPVADVLSPFRGTDVFGPTAVVKSVSKLDNYLLSGGAILNVKFAPSLFDSPNALDRLIDLVRGYFDLNGMEIQFNVISAEVLRAAQKKPEEHKDLIVRVAGYSAYFVVQDPRVQEDIIARTEHKAF